MNKDLLKCCRNEYFKRISENKQKKTEIETLLRQQEVLENNPVVKEYIELLKQIEKYMGKIESESQVFLRTLFEFKNKGLVDSTNNILLYAGTFINDQEYAIMVERDCPTAEFDKYINIESSEELYIPVEDRKIFEEGHKVVILDGSDSLYKLHNQFMYDAIVDGEEVACNKILSRNKKNL